MKKAAEKDYMRQGVRHSVKLTILTHCILVDSSTVICWTSQFDILGVPGQFCHSYSIFDGKSC